MNIETIKIKDLLNDPSNVRKHDERNLDSIKASLQRFGQQKPIVVDGKGIVVAGNGTLDAAKSLGWKDIEIVRTELVGADAVAYAIADNRTAELAIWDDDALAQTLAALKLDESIDEAITGFTDQEIEELIGKSFGDIVEDEVPEVQFSEFVGELSNYVVLTFNNEIDWLAAKTHFNIQTASCTQTNGKVYTEVLGRVVNGAEYLTNLTKDKI
jgi:ParB-like chromosome segregation protein Spo0J